MFIYFLHKSCNLIQVLESYFYLLLFSILHIWMSYLIF
jgi:hypothetical protein